MSWLSKALSLINVSYDSTTGALRTHDEEALAALNTLAGCVAPTNTVAHTTPVALGATATLATLLGGPLNANLKGLIIIASAVGGFYAVGAASAATAALPAVLDIPITKATADTWQFFGTGQTITVLEKI